MTRGPAAGTRWSLPWLPTTWPGRAVTAGGSLLSLGGLAHVSPIAAVTVVVVAGLVIVTALVTRALPMIIAARTVARTAKQACSNPQAERTLRILTGTGHLDARTSAAGAVAHIVGTPPGADSVTAAGVSSDPEPDRATLTEVAPVRKIAA